VNVAHVDQLLLNEWVCLAARGSSQNEVYDSTDEISVFT